MVLLLVNESRMLPVETLPSKVISSMLGICALVNSKVCVVDWKGPKNPEATRARTTAPMMKTTSAGADGRSRKKPAMIIMAPAITNMMGNAYGDATPRIAVRPANMKKKAPITYQRMFLRRYMFQPSRDITFRQMPIL